GIKMEVDQKQTTLIIKGVDKVLVGDLAARIRKIRPPEPYKGSGVRYQGEHITRKAGKTAAAGAAGTTGAAK
ncbi:MAG: 50S ribosomal protein L6, partial [Elusimicrobia bacterium]|nr:50S ribosomal protein L6 [Elusimicrobiota bacterium]